MRKKRIEFYNFVEFLKKYNFRLTNNLYNRELAEAKRLDDKFGSARLCDVKFPRQFVMRSLESVLSKQSNSFRDEKVLFATPLEITKIILYLSLPRSAEKILKRRPYTLLNGAVRSVNLAYMNANEVKGFGLDDDWNVELGIVEDKLESLKEHLGLKQDEIKTILFDGLTLLIRLYKMEKFKYTAFLKPLVKDLEEHGIVVHRKSVITNGARLSVEKDFVTEDDYEFKVKIDEAFNEVPNFSQLDDDSKVD